PLPLAARRASPAPSVVTHHAVERTLPLGVTGHAPPHRQGSNLGELGHRLDLPVALLAGQPYLDVALVRKVHEPGDLVDPYPLDRLGVLPISPELLDFLLELGILGGHDLMATHTPLDRGQTSEGRAPRVGVAVLAINLEVACVDLVAEQDGLLRALCDRRLGVGRCAADS